MTSSSVQFFVPYVLHGAKKNEKQSSFLPFARAKGRGATAGLALKQPLILYGKQKCYNVQTRQELLGHFAEVTIP